MAHRYAARTARHWRSASPPESVGSALRIMAIMRSGLRAGATRSSRDDPALRPGPQAPRADLNITTIMFPRAGRLRSLNARRSSASSARRLAPCRRHARRGASGDCKKQSAGDTVLIAALSLTAQRETLGRRSATLGPPAPQGAVRPRVAPPHTQPRFVLAPAAARHGSEATIFLRCSSKQATASGSRS